MYRNMLPNKQFPYVDTFKLGKAYVPYQMMVCVMEPEEGLKKGTIFPELYSPYRRDEQKFM